MDNEKIITSIELRDKNPNSSADFYSQAAYTSSFYYHTRLDVAKKVLSKEGLVFYISPISGMNDENEKDLHNKNKDRTYILCFSHLKTESIPMWYLYSGITGEGARIGLKPARMKDLIDSAIVLYPVYNGKMETSRPLTILNDYDLEYGWVFYRNKADRSIKHKEIQYNLSDSLDAFERDNFFVKDREWSYEKEFRLVFRLKNEIPERVALVLDKRIMMADDGLKLTLSPLLKDSDINLLAEQLGLPVRLVSASKINAKMDLLKRNQQSIIDHFSECISGLDEDDLERIKLQIEKEIIRVKQHRVRRS